MKPELWLPIAIPAASFIGTLAVVVVGFLYSNSRISDLRGDIGGRLADFSTRMTDLRVFLTDTQKSEAERQDANLLRVEDMLLHKFAELDNRLSSIERRFEGR